MGSILLPYLAMMQELKEQAPQKCRVESRREKLTTINGKIKDNFISFGRRARDLKKKEIIKGINRAKIVLR